MPYCGTWIVSVRWVGLDVAIGLMEIQRSLVRKRYGVREGRYAKFYDRR